MYNTFIIQLKWFALTNLIDEQASEEKCQAFEQTIFKLYVYWCGLVPVLEIDITVFDFLTIS